MTTYQSQTVYTVDREGNSLAFSTVNEPGEEAVLKAQVDVEMPDGQKLPMSVLYSSNDVNGLLAYLHDNFGRGVQPGLKPGVTYPFVDGAVVIIGPECFIDMSGEVLSYQGRNYVPQASEENNAGTDLPGMWEQSDFSGGEADTAADKIARQCAVIYNGVQCGMPADHVNTPGSVHHFVSDFLPQNDAGAVPPPADVQGAVNTPQSVSPDQSAAESATAALTAEAAPASTPAEPKKRKRRTKLEIAFDTAMEKWGKGEGDSAQISDEIDVARKALAAKDPSNSRLSQFAIPAAGTPAPVPTELPVGFAPEQPVVGGPWALPPGQQPVPGQVYAPDADGGIPAQAFSPTFLAGQTPELGTVQQSPEEVAAAQAFPCPVQSSDGRACQRPYGHELQTATNPQPKPHVYATVPSQLPYLGGDPSLHAVEEAFEQQHPTIPALPTAAPVNEHSPFSGPAPAQSVPFQVPPTPQQPHPDTNIQPPAAPPTWSQPI